MLYIAVPEVIWPDFTGRCPHHLTLKTSSGWSFVSFWHKAINHEWLYFLGGSFVKYRTTMTQGVQSNGGLFQGFLNFCGRNFHMTLGTRVYKYTNHICWLSHKEIYFGATIWYTLILLKIRTNFHTDRRMHFTFTQNGILVDKFSPQTRVPNSKITTAESAASQKGAVQRTVPFQKFLKFCPKPKSVMIFYKIKQSNSNFKNQMLTQNKPKLYIDLIFTS